MLNFTVGPVMSSESVRAIGAEQVPYFRTPEFSTIMLENEQLIKKFAKADETSRVVFLTGSGTSAMEASIINCLMPYDKAVVINGGSFGERFVELCSIHSIPFTEIRLEHGKALTKEHLEPFEDKGYTTFIINMHETSTGVLYDMDIVSEFCKRNNLFLIVDAISAFLADPVDMAGWGVDVLFSGSQKALACPPGIAVMVLSERALKRVSHIDSHCMYLDLKKALDNARRGQTPFTPAVSVLLQIHKRLKEIEANGGIDAEILRTANLAAYFRKKIVELPFAFVSESPSNAVTPLHPLTASAKDIFDILKNEYGIWVCPNGGEMKDTVFRVGHIGFLSPEDYDVLIAALKDLQLRKII